MTYHDTELRLGIKENGIVLRRGHRPATNVPHLFHHHSPDGYEWGYGGSGPTDLAFNIAEWFLRHLNWDGPKTTTYSGHRVFCLAWELRQDVKHRWIASCPREGGVVPYDELLSYFKEAIQEAL